MVYPVSTYLTALVFGIITNRNVDYINSEKLRAASAIGGNIAHELRTPLASIRSLARAMNKYSQILVDTYAKARELGAHTGDLNREQVEGLRSALLSIEKEVQYSNTIIDMLLLNTSERSPHLTRVDTFALSDAVSEAIDRFPFNNTTERALIQVQVVQDFRVGASRLLVIHVLFNLIKNGIHYAQKSPGGTLHISVGTSKGRRLVEITDTGPGISPAARRHIFDRFYTTSDTSQGAGIGLSFCKTVMHSIGGDIHCDSRHGQYTTFRLTFPT
jgi:two-component system CAI-1 autoinducer sensor kinase/phosphatase CqsS